MMWEQSSSRFTREQKVAVEQFKVIRDKVLSERWQYSVNARLYAKEPMVVDLTPVSAVAAIVLGVYESNVATNSLTKSLSLRREANNAPVLKEIIGAVSLALKRQMIKETTTVPPTCTSNLRAIQAAPSTAGTSGASRAAPP